MSYIKTVRGNKNKLTIYVLIAMLAGSLLGYIVHEKSSSSFIASFSVDMNLLTTIFLRLVQMIIAPLVFSTLVVGIAKLGDLKSFWKCSMSAIIMKAHSVGAIDETEKTILFKKMSASGYNKQEPSFGLSFEYPILFHQLINLHLTELEYSETELADMLRIYVSEFSNLNDFYSPTHMKIIRKIA